ncbi:MAG: hypothetical protein KJ587_13415 [Alphaproteobacteria bacterium]|nr:hypothetical protein [Alphaproteobacteria bacterium]
MSVFRSSSLLAAGVILAVGSSAARADMGTAPVTEGIIVGIEGGFLHQDLDAVNGYGIRSPGGRLGEAFADPENGWFAGAMLGYASRQPIIFNFSRIEGYFLFGRTEDSVGASSPPAGDLTIKSVDGSVNVVGGKSASTSVERHTYEGGLRLEDDQVVDAVTNVTWVVQPFLRFAEEDTDTVVNGCCSAFRAASVDNRLFGVLVAVEPEYWFNPGLAIVGRAGVGIYGYNADGDFRSYSQSPFVPDPFKASVSDDESGVGFRGSLGAALKFKISDTSRIETFAEADYFSAVGTAAFSNANPANGRASRVDIDDMWELRAGARLTIGFGSP